MFVVEVECFGLIENTKILCLWIFAVRNTFYVMVSRNLTYTDGLNPIQYQSVKFDVIRERLWNDC